MENLFIRENFGSYVYSSLADFLSIGSAKEAKPEEYNYSFSNETITGSKNWAPSFGAMQLGLYAQDKWNLTDNFNFTYGLRVDMPLYLDKPSINEKFNASEIAKSRDLATNKMPSSTPLFSPRVGFRWDINRDNSFLVRGGAGIFTGRIPFVWISNSFGNTGVEYIRTRLQTADLKNINLTAQDVVVGIAASGRTPYVIAGLEYARQLGCRTVGISCNPGSAVSTTAEFAITPIVGAEVVTGSSRMKAGTAQKLVLNMLSTGLMIKSGKVFGNLMVDVVATNEKLHVRQVNIVKNATGCNAEQAEAALIACERNCKTAIVMVLKNLDAAEAKKRLDQHGGFIRQVLDKE